MKTDAVSSSKNQNTNFTPRKRLLAGTFPTHKNELAGTVQPNKNEFARIVPGVPYVQCPNAWACTNDNLALVGVPIENTGEFENCVGP